MHIFGVQGVYHMGVCEQLWMLKLYSLRVQAWMNESILNINVLTGFLEPRINVII